MIRHLFLLIALLPPLHAQGALTLRWLTEGEAALTSAEAPAEPAENEPRLPRPDEENGSRFALQVFSELVKNSNGQSIVFSPASVEGVLRLLRIGARGKTALELAALPLGSADSTTTIRLHEANALFADESLTLRTDIPQGCIYRVPFKKMPSVAAARINGWVRQQTRGMIPTMVTPAQFGNQSTALLAANAIALEEKWLRPFDRMQTSPNYTFTRADGSTTTVNMMFNTAQYRSAAGDDWVAVALMYRAEGRSGHHGCLVGILPHDNAREFAATLTHEKYESIRRALALATPMELRVGLPAIEQLTPCFSLRDALQACGVRSLFSEAEANLSGFSDSRLFVRDIQQRCYVKMDEQGVKAAAVTMAHMWDHAVAQPPTEIIFERPFIWLITELTGPATPRFMGFFEGK